MAGGLQRSYSPNACADSYRPRRLRHDPLLALVCGRKDITGQDRCEPDESGVPLAGKSTLNRLELTPVGARRESRYKKVVANIGRLQETLTDLFVRMRAKQEVPEELILDLDATDDPVHGDQLGKFFHGDYKSYCFLPLYIFCGDWPLLALLRPSNLDASAGSVEQLQRIVPKLRAAWPDVRIIIRGDSAGGAGSSTAALSSWVQACPKSRAEQPARGGFVASRS